MKFFRILIFFSLFTSCQNIEEVKKPENLIPEKKMVTILTDLAILNSAKNYNKRLLEEKGVQPDAFLYKKHNIDSVQLAESTLYYAKDSNTFEKILQRVKNNLERSRREIEIKKAEEEQKLDSLRTMKSPLDSVAPSTKYRIRKMDSLSVSPVSTDF